MFDWVKHLEGLMLHRPSFRVADENAESDYISDPGSSDVGMTVVVKSAIIYRLADLSKGYQLHHSYS